MITLANEEDIKEIMNIFKKFRDIFPHIRSDKVLTQIKNKLVIFQDGVVITFGKYKKRLKLGTVDIHRGAWILHQIVNNAPRNGMSVKVLKDFLNYTDNDCYLTVRADNETARTFYEKNGFKKVGDISWKSGQIIGKIYCRKFLNTGV